MSMRSFVDDEERFSHCKDIRPLTRAATRPRSYTATVYYFVANTRSSTANCKLFQHGEEKCNFKRQ
jgi:hypothetical protein